MIQGLRTVIYPVADLTEAAAWYARVAGKPPYFDQPFYVGFEIGGFELGATVDAPVTDVGEGIRVATVRDPFGNLFGIIQNPHFDLSKLA